MAESTGDKKIFRIDNNYYRNKSIAIEKMIKDNVYENGAICDEIVWNQEKLLLVQEECKFLTEKIKFFESQHDTSRVVQVNNTAINKSNSKKKTNVTGTFGVVQVNNTAVNKSSSKKKTKGTGTSGVVRVNNTAVNKSSAKKKTKVTGTSGVVRVNNTAVNKSSSKKKTKVTGTSGVVRVNNTAVNKSSSKKKTKVTDVIKPKRQTKKKKTEIEQPIITGNVTIYKIGKIIYDTPFYYSDSAIYPVGYYATRTYAHYRNLFIKCTYHCKVFKTDLSPRFEIMDHDKHFKVIGSSTNECHSYLLALINKMLGTDDLISANTNGDRFFGLTLPPVRFKLEEKPESKFCTGYIPLKLQSNHHEIELEAENDPSVSFEGLHACLNRFRSRNSDSD